jgi:hypothetical protein
MVFTEIHPDLMPARHAIIAEPDKTRFQRRDAGEVVNYLLFQKMSG